MPPEQPAAALRLDLDLDALQHNWRSLDRMSGSARAGAAIKANGYGLGSQRVAQALHAAGCRDFFVAHWCEAADLGDAIAPAALAVFHGPLTEADCAFALATGVRPVINSIPQARRWNAAGGGRCDLMVDTGMNRLGLPLGDLADESIAQLEIEVLHSHLACADEESPLNDLQQQRWSEVRTRIPHRRAALANSAGIALGAQFHGDLTRPGLSLYGGIPRPELEGVIRQVAQPAAAVLQVRDIAAGEGVGYNSQFVAPRAMRIGTIAVGYADGYLRCWSGIGSAANKASPLPVLGRVSMDLTILDLSAAPETCEGDWVTIDYDLPRAASLTGLSQYELLTLLGRRFAR
ncbi:alanine racemase [Novosphingobium aquimarinum]|uniref:alanine racemase n=1 Tax=Novosphingobium aquimarinum TaxID=2682494 RepID=UPI0012ECA620|nr:alanine racemase [Novosphingobium aquimarinum]